MNAIIVPPAGVPAADRDVVWIGIDPNDLCLGKVAAQRKHLLTGGAAEGKDSDPRSVADLVPDEAEDRRIAVECRGRIGLKDAFHTGQLEKRLPPGLAKNELSQHLRMIGETVT